MRPPEIAAEVQEMEKDLRRISDRLIAIWNECEGRRDETGTHPFLVLSGSVLNNVRTLRRWRLETKDV